MSKNQQARPAQNPSAPTQSAPQAAPESQTQAAAGAPPADNVPTSGTSAEAPIAWKVGDRAPIRAVYGPLRNLLTNKLISSDEPSKMVIDRFVELQLRAGKLIVDHES